MRVALPLSLALAAVYASPIEERASSVSVKIKNGTVIGSTSNSVDSFLGVPYAQPPTGSLRLKPPQSITKTYGTFTATATPKSCPQQANGVNTSSLIQNVIDYLEEIPIFGPVSDQSEDCLTINVQRPAGTTSTSKLPVVFWIFGGAFEGSSTSRYDGTSIVQKSVSLNAPIIYVAVNYRVSGWGFLAGSALAKEGSTNLGLRDQRLGLEWVADNIASFGGDPTKVTLWGESAGAISVFDHTIINGGVNTYNGAPLFRGAIMNSGSIIPTDPVTAPQAQTIYDTVVLNAGCSGQSDTLSCLRGVSAQTFYNAVNSVPGAAGYRSVDLSYLPRPDPGNNFFSKSPELSVQAGAYAKVPVIIGDQEDEGTLFSLNQFNISFNSDLINYFASYFPNDPNAVSQVTTYVNYYPDEADIGQPYGSPFNTSSNNNIYREYKRLAAVLGDVVFTLTRRTYLGYVTKNVKAWSYLSTFFHNQLPVLGTFHGTDLLYTYALLGTNQPITDIFQTYFVSFVTHLDPNALGTTAPVTNWPQWTASGLQLLNISASGNSLILDNFRSPQAQFISSNINTLRV